MRTTNKTKLTKFCLLYCRRPPIRIPGPAAFTCGLNPLQNVMPTLLQ